MRIEGWRIDGFGILRDMEVADLGHGVTVFLGENEAGKSTLLAFLRAMLFGFPDKRTRENLYPPLAGGRHGGQITLRDERGLWTITRYSDKRKLIVIDGPDGRHGEEDDLRSLLSGVDATLFKSVFAFSLDELQRFATLDAEGVRERIFSVGISGAGQSARAVLKQLADQEARLLKQRAGQARINDLLRAIERVEESVRQAEREAAGYAELTSAEDDQRRRVTGLDETLTALAATHRRYQILSALHPEWEELAAAERLIAELPAPSDPDLPAAVGGLIGRLHVLRSREETLSALHANAVTANADLQRHLQHLGPDWTAERLQTVDDSITQRDTVRDWRRRLTDALAAVDQAVRDEHKVRDDLTELRDDHARCSLELPSTPPPSSETLSETEARLRGLRSQLRELQMAELQAPPDGTAQRRVWLLAAPAALLTLVAALAAGAAGAMYLALGLAAEAVILGLVALLARAGAPRAGRGRDADAIDLLRLHVTEDAHSLGLGERPSEAELNALEAKLVTARQQRTACDVAEARLRQIEGQLTRAQARAADLAQTTAAARTSAERQQAEWADWATSRGLPSVSPEGMLELFDDVRLARTAHRALLETRAAISATEEERATWNQEARTALAGAGIGAAAYSGPQLEAAVTALDEALAKRAEALDRRAACEQRLRNGLADLGDADQARRELIEGDPAVWRAEMERLAAEMVAANHAKTTAIEARRDAQRARETLEESADVPRLQAELESLRAELARAAHEYRVITTAAGLVRTTLQSYVRDRQPGVLERASTAFSTVTGGRFRAIVQEAAEETDTVVVEQWDGARLAPDDLSRGTCEQLYLAIRLALVEEFAGRGQELPLIMDDCLVNFDPVRAAAMARLIAVSATDGQCLFFTCHPGIAELMRHASGDTARVISLAGRSHRPSSAEPSTATRRVR